ncbi:acetylglutamate kinase [Acanthopleuribacter pedis]|uniref:Acetylglutamate kinase n=1 Tax=Acanthopleuribacter pedis TaxID=442870 RepID=A0A8J7Q4C5_9BACT|nr:acetylglutamate kinase [Acanthopleuribacter pedis]MBO1317832.1 acetylglutamate kinase [Acanthopleuribacter pedis]
MNIDVFKLGGGESDNQAFLAQLARNLNGHPRPFVIIHGGGREVAQLQNRLGIQPSYVAGLRVTDGETLKMVEMVLVGSVNKRIVRTLFSGGLRAVGLSGADMGLLRATRKTEVKGEPADLGFVGEISGVNSAFLRDLLAQGLVPVIAPVAFGEDGHAYNVNADSVALAVAKALDAYSLTFVTDVPGVRDGSGQWLDQITTDAAQDAIQQGVIRDGMIPKIEAATGGVSAGIARVQIGGIERATVVCG